jgi:hypothetical protein
MLFMVEVMFIIDLFDGTKKRNAYPKGVRGVRQNRRDNIK